MVYRLTKIEERQKTFFYNNCLLSNPFIFIRNNNIYICIFATCSKEKGFISMSNREIEEKAKKRLPSVHQVSYRHVDVPKLFVQELVLVQITVQCRRIINRGSYLVIKFLKVL